MASLYQRPGSKNWYIKMLVNGAEERFSAKTTDKTKAQEKLNILLVDQSMGRPFRPKSALVRFCELGEMVMTDYEVNGFRTLREARSRFEKHILPFFGLMPAANITTIEITKYTTRRLAAGASKATVRRELELVRRAFTLGERAHKIVAPYIPMPKTNNVRQGFFEEDEFERVMAALDNDDYRDVLTFLYITGWRTGEMKNLRRRNIDFKNNCIRLDPGTTKNGDGRVFKFMFGIDQMLRRRMESPGFGNDYVFTYTVCAKDGRVVPLRKKDGTVLHGPRQIGDFQKAFNTACYKAGIPCETKPWSYISTRGGKVVSGVKITRCSRLLHDLRRTAVRNLTASGLTETIAMQMTGHRTRAVFDRYRIVSERDLTMAAEIMDEAYAPLLARLEAAQRARNAAGTKPGTVG